MKIHSIDTVRSRVLRSILLISLPFQISTAQALEIHDAALNGDFKRVEAIVSKNPEMVKARDDNGNAPLTKSALNGHTEIARYLISKGAEVNEKNTKGNK